MAAADNIENNIEWLTNQRKAAASFTQEKWVKKIKKLYEEHPEEMELHENYDGSIFVKFPLKWVKISCVKRQLTDEQKQAMAERLKKAREEGKMNTFKKKESNE